MIRQPQSRRGVVILVVLSLLVLFVLLVVTFAIVAGQYRRAAQAYARKEWLGEDPQKIADRVMYAALREPDMNQTGSPLRGHALLTDVYGRSINNGQVVGGVTSLAGGQILEFYDESPPIPPATSLKYRDLTGFYNGCVLTFSSGTLRNTSTRVVGYRYTPANPPGVPNHVHTFRIMLPTVSGSAPVAPSVGDTFVLNGKPFVGTGFGYVGATAGNPRLSDEALKPNRTGDSLATLLNWVTGGANESYDAPDYQNLLLAAVVRNPATGVTQVLPSLHRPELVAHWLSRDPTNWNVFPPATDPAISPSGNVYLPLTTTIRDFRRKIVFRPMPWDHPNFTGSNPAFDPNTRTAEEIDNALVTGPWDVDNDGDGVKDSIWIDPDLPVQTTDDGRVYKPLVAIHCVDLDGRVNVNAQGHYGQLAGVLAGYPVPQAMNLPGGTTSQTLPKGQGYGPPEVDLNKLINDNTQYQVLLQSRYGADTSPGQVGYDALMPFKFYEYPNNYFSTAFLTSFGSNMDLRGLFACGVDHRGQPLHEGIYDTSTSPWTFPDILAESPYELNLNKPSGADAPFTVAELEKVLRYPDFDSSTLQSRLTDLTTLTFLQGNTVAAQTARRAVTTDSWDIPVPGVVCPDDYVILPLSLPYAQTIMELLAARLGSAFSGAALDNEISKMLSPDLIMGLRMDINRPIGNGRDDNGNGSVDEHTGYAAAFALNESANPNEERAKIGGAVDTTPPMAIDHDNDGVALGDNDAFLVRHYLAARHLYVLLRLLKDDNARLAYNSDASDDIVEDARNAAQWAINVVDFRDADSIMTPFEYDRNPFNGWDVDGIPTDRGADTLDNDGDGSTDEADEQELEREVVWGCERPELLLSGTLAFHDRRTEDLASDPSGATTTNPPAPANDLDFDQRLRPRGSLFVELYNPWAGHDRVPAEFYYNGGWTQGVVLNKVNAGNSPVWRLAITTDDPNPDGPIEPTGGNLERTVYFANPAALTGGNLGSQMHYSTILNVAPLLPGRYAVVGSAGVLTGGAYVTTVGRRTDADEATSLALDKTRQIALAPNVNPNVNQVEVRNNLSPPPTPGDPTTVDPPMDGFATPPAQVQPAIAVPVNAVFNAADPPNPLPLSLSISEPLGGYPDPGGGAWDPTAAAGEGAYVTPYDDPHNAAIDPPTRVPQGNGTSGNFRRIHLQRLANPLLPYHDETNPYLTMNVMPVDLTVFNGATTTADPINPQGLTRFHCWARGDSDVAPNLRRLWPQERATTPVADSAREGAPAVHRFDFVLQHTLGTLNSNYLPAFGTATAPAAHNFALTDYVGAPDANTGGPPFQWLPWNNRPFVSPTELLLVPRTTASRLLWEFDVASGTPYDNLAGRFRHTLNFFFTGVNAAVNPADPPNLYRLFEYLTVRPRFAGTETMLNPSTTSPHFGSNAVGTEMLHPPFNLISSYREPGRINLNTIYDSRVWDALWAGHQGITFNDFVDNRRGYGAAGGNIFPPVDPNTPTFFANPYRATGSALLVPPDASGGTNLARLEVDSSLLRTIRATGGLTPLPATTDVPRYLNAFTDMPRNSDRNPYFSYQAMQRLPNMVTCRSNVYAIWITIGYFEFEFNPTTNQRELGQEVGIDTGTVTRNRAFYIIDRTIPVAFDPGQNHNVDKCVLLRRFIE